MHVVDQMVQKAQRWVNATYSGRPGYNTCSEDGVTGWSTMHSLTRALQIELGITVPSDTFGQGTLEKLQQYGKVGLSSTNMKMRTIAEAALYCKGYSGGDLDGTFNVNTQVGLAAICRNMGLEEPSPVGNVDPKMFKALLTMDAYVLLSGGSASIQAAQRYLNGAYIGRGKFFIGPCDGFFSRNVQQALVLALQYEMGMSDDAVTGTIGPGTRDGLKTKAVVRQGSLDTGISGFVRLFHSALIFNGYKGRTGQEAREFTADTAFTVRAFQEFSQLPRTGVGDYQTWMSLLLSTGDPDRKGTAFDCRNPLTQAKIATLKANGYKIAGRYLTGATDKTLTNSEIALIHTNGLAFFPIYQNYNNGVQWFDYEKGKAAGAEACRAARSFGIPYGTVLYIAVDFDALDVEISSAVIPFFRGVRDAVATDGNRFAVGVYGCRNVCIRLAAAGLAVRSFVSSMSTGYSGNLGYPLPENWAFDQIKNVTLAPGAAGAIEIDNDIASGRDPGVDSVTRPRDPNDAFFTYLLWIEQKAKEWRAQGHTSRSQAMLTSQYLRSGSGRFTFPWATEVFGELDTGFVDYANAAASRPDAAPLRDPRHFWDTDLAHFGASFGAVITHGFTRGGTQPNRADFGSWGGDFLSVVGQFTQSGLPDDQAYSFAAERLATRADDSFLSLGDLFADVDAMVLGQDCRANSTLLLSTLFRQHYATPASATARFAAYYSRRFASSRVTAEQTAHNMVLGGVADTFTAVIREGFWYKDFRSPRYPLLETLPAPLVDSIARAWADVLVRYSS